MRLVTFAKDGGKPRIGAVIDGGVVDFNEALGSDSVPADMTRFLEMGEAALNLAQQAISKGSVAAIPLADVTLMAPVPRPPKLMMGGRNYLRHIEELKAGDATIPVPETPRIFSKYHTAITGPGHPVIYPKLTSQLDFEGELSVVIGQSGSFIPESEAMEYVVGYTIVNDVTARDIQERNELIVSKNFVTFAPMGPWIVTKDEGVDPHNLNVRTYINDRQVSECHTSEMIFSIPQFIAFLSQVFPLEVGDVLTTGSPPGPGRYHNPPILTNVGDVMRIEVEGVGVLENPVVPQP